MNVGVSSPGSVLSSLVGMWSGPVALCSLSVHISLWMPSAIWCYCDVLHEWVFIQLFGRVGVVFAHYNLFPFSNCSLLPPRPP